MKQLYKAALLAALGLASVSSVHAAYTAGDLLVGFTTASGSDLVYDLGQESALQNGETFSALSSLLSSDFSDLSIVNWGVIGNGANSGTVRTAWTTTSPGVGANTVTGSGAFGKLNTVAVTLAGSTLTGAGTHNSPLASSSTSWNTETLNGTLAGDYNNAYENPNVLGVGSADFSQILNDGSTPTVIGSFALGANDSFTYTAVAVPEPTTYGMLAGAGLLVVSLRNQLRRKQA
jgi:hypothetical protein